MNPYDPDEATPSTKGWWLLLFLFFLPLNYLFKNLSRNGGLEPYSKQIHWRLIIYLFAIFATLLNNIGTQQMGYYMPAYVSFSLYFTTLCYILLFAFTAYIREERWKLTTDEILWVVLCGFLTGIGGIFSQAAVPYIAPEFSAMFTQFQSPITWVITPFLFKDRPLTTLRLAGIIVMTGGLLYGSIYSIKHGTGSTNSNENPAWAMILCLVSALFAAILTVVQEHMYRRIKIDKFVSLTYYNLITLPMYSLWIFANTNSKLGQCIPNNVTVDVTQCVNELVACQNLQEVNHHEAEAFKCFFTGNATCCGGILATVWVLIFIIGYWLMFAIQTLLLDCKNLGSDAVANTIAIGTPLSMCFFWWKELAGEGFGYTEFKPWILVSCICVGFGLFIYEMSGKIKKNQDDYVEIV